MQLQACLPTDQSYDSTGLPPVRCCAPVQLRATVCCARLRAACPACRGAHAWRPAPAVGVPRQPWQFAALVLAPKGDPEAEPQRLPPLSNTTHARAHMRTHRPAPPPPSPLQLLRSRSASDNNSQQSSCQPLNPQRASDSIGSRESSRELPPQCGVLSGASLRDWAGRPVAIAAGSGGSSSSAAGGGDPGCSFVTAGAAGPGAALRVEEGAAAGPAVFVNPWAAASRAGELPAPGTAPSAAGDLGSGSAKGQGSGVNPALQSLLEKV